MFNKILLCTILFIFSAIYSSYAATSSPQIVSINGSTTKSIQQYGITWTFSEPVQYGQFVNGDYWVVGSNGKVILQEISPKTFTENVSGTNYARHGSMINPSPTLEGNTGYGTIQFHIYVPTLNIEESLPYTAPSGSSIVSVILYTSSDPRPGNSWVKAAAVLTVLPTPPPPGSFRPAYSGTDKSIKFNKSQLDYNKLQNLPLVSGTPDITTVEAAFQRPWIDHMPGHRAQRAHPYLNMPEYGAWMHDRINVAALMLNLNYTKKQKENLLIYFIQLGIDLFGIIQENNKTWIADGGHSGGRKLPIMFAGLVLNNQNMLLIAQKSGDYLHSNGYGPGNVPPDYIHFGEDSQTDYVTQLDVDITNQKNSIKWTPSGIPLTDSTWNTYSYGSPYSSQDIGLPEYGIRHAMSPGWNTKQWDAYKSYRNLADRPFPMTALVGHIMGLKSMWNHNALFDYADRFVTVTAIKSGWWFGEFQKNMWDTYRRNYPIIY